jgi:hypothetical protein
MSKKLFLYSVILFLAGLAVSCENAPDYERVAADYLKAGYVGNIEQARKLAVPEASIIFDFTKMMYAQRPQLLKINKDASCEVIHSEVNEKDGTAQVTLEESNVYAYNIYKPEKPALIETQETIINLVKRNNKWFVLVKQ